MTRMRIPIIVLFFAVSMALLGQDLTSGGPDSIIGGPFGEPRMVMSEGGEWSYPIKVFANSEVETFVPDITSPGWVSWHVAEFVQSGTYVTYLYIYHRNSHRTSRETINVDTRSNSAIIARPLLAPTRISIPKAPSDLAKSIARITEIVTKEAKEFQGMTVQDSIMQEKYVQLRMALCTGPGTPNPDCSLSDSDFQRKHPIYVANPQRLIDGARPGVNCGVGTNRSCYYYAPENLEVDRPASPISPTAVLPSATAAGDGLYRVGGAVSAPIPLNTVEAKFTDEARRAKYQGICQVSMIIDAQGNPQNPRVVRGLDMGLSEKALEAVRQYKFKPAMLEGKTPVPVMITVNVNFRLY